jgi:hypothetical protein
MFFSLHFIALTFILKHLRKYKQNVSSSTHMFDHNFRDKVFWMNIEEKVIKITIHDIVYRITNNQRLLSNHYKLSFWYFPNRKHPILLTLTFIYSFHCFYTINRKRLILSF